VQSLLQGKGNKYYMLCTCVFVDLVIQHAMRMLRTAMWSVRLYEIVSHYLINGTIFENKCY
jgi:hypothetical protein